MNVVAIHQPNFFPWLGYFNKIIRSDVFVILDDVQLPKKGGTWSNRVKTLNNGDAKWLTAPIVRDYSGVKAINEVYFDVAKPWRQSLLSNIVQNYKQAPFYSDVFPVLEALLFYEEDNIARYNTHAITVISEKLSIDTSRFRLSSSIPYQGQSNEMLVEIVKHVGGDVYMCGGGASDYQDESVFNNAGLALSFQNFKHPVYEQETSADFVQGLSIIDALMNVGWVRVAELLRDGECA